MQSAWNGAPRAEKDFARVGSENESEGNKAGDKAAHGHFRIESHADDVLQQQLAAVVHKEDREELGEAAEDRRKRGAECADRAMLRASCCSNNKPERQSERQGGKCQPDREPRAGCQFVAPSVGPELNQAEPGLHARARPLPRKRAAV